MASPHGGSDTTNRGELATIGRGAAWRPSDRSGSTAFLAWVAWVFVHLLYLIEFENRFIVLTRWAWDFFHRERGSRLITGDPACSAEPDAWRDPGSGWEWGADAREVAIAARHRLGNAVRRRGLGARAGPTNRTKANAGGLRIAEVAVGRRALDSTPDMPVLGDPTAFTQPAPPADEIEPVPRRAVLTVGLVMGLVTSTYSTLVVFLISGRAGRDVELSWMEVAMVLLGRSSVESEPTIRTSVPGMLTHMAADFWWAFLFWGLLARWTWPLRPRALLPVLPLWAGLTAAFEYWVVLPWLQPWLIMQTPYWIALIVHLASASAYPLAYVVRDAVLRRRAPHRTAARRTAVALVIVLAVLAVPAALAQAGREPRWPMDSATAAYTQSFMVDMAHHHEVGVELALLAAERAERTDLRHLGRLMAAEQAAEIDWLRRWWRSWFGGDLPQPSAERMATMPGMPSPATMAELAGLEGAAFDNHFLSMMMLHHHGAIVMADGAVGRATDPRLILFADQLRHAQIGQVRQMAAWAAGAGTPPGIP